MTDCSLLEDLLARVNRASRREIALERAIMCGPGGWVRLKPSEHPRNHKHPMFVDTQEAYGTFEGQTLYRDVPRIMESVDAAIAFIERVLPGRAAELLREALSDLGKRFAWHIRTEKPGEIAMLPLALLAVGLSALILKEKADG